MDGSLGDLKPYQQALDEIFERRGVAPAYLYGSQARGDAGPLSDVDVAVLFGPDVPENERFNRVLHLIGEKGSPRVRSTNRRVLAAHRCRRG